MPVATSTTAPSTSTASRQRIRNSSCSRRKRRHSKYHKLAFSNKLGSILEGPLEDKSESINSSQHGRKTRAALQDGALRLSLNGNRPDIGDILGTNVSKADRIRLVCEAKMSILSDLARSGGEASTDTIQRNLHKLITNYNVASNKNFDPRCVPPTPAADASGDGAFCVCGPHATRLEGTWMSLAKPDFHGCLGKNEHGDYLYTLGRMSFDMFQPTQLICSIQGSFNVIQVVDGWDEAALAKVPKSLRGDVRHGKVPVRSYNVVTAFTIEPGKPGDTGPNAAVEEPIEGIMTVYGYCLPYPKGNRFNIWFTGGSLEVGDGNDQWNQVFHHAKLPPRTLSERTRVFAAKLLVGAKTSTSMDENGKISFHFTNPIASNIDLIFIDERFRFMRAKSGTLYMFQRVQGADEVPSDDSDPSRCQQRSLGDAPELRYRNTGSKGRMVKPTRSRSPNSTMVKPTRSRSPHKRELMMKPTRSMSPQQSCSSRDSRCSPPHRRRRRSRVLDEDGTDMANNVSNSHGPQKPIRRGSGSTFSSDSGFDHGPRQPTRRGSACDVPLNSIAGGPRQAVRRGSVDYGAHECTPAGNDDDFKIQ